MNSVSPVPYWHGKSPVVEMKIGDWPWRVSLASDRSWLREQYLFNQNQRAMVDLMRMPFWESSKCTALAVEGPKAMVVYSGGK